MTRSNLYRNADFEASTEEGCALKPEDVASAVNYVLSLEKGIQVPEIELLPQFHRIAKKTGAKM